jgi:enediyne biosynthesis protein E4
MVCTPGLPALALSVLSCSGPVTVESDFSFQPLCSSRNRPAFVEGEDLGDFSSQDPDGWRDNEDDEWKIYNFGGGGLVAGDFDGDGWEDIYLATVASDELYLGTGSRHFVRAEGWIPDGEQLSVGGAAADYDGDGDLDLYVAVNGAADLLYRNDGDHFTDVLEVSGMDPSPADSVAAVWYDFDLDGDLDLFRGAHYNHLFDLEDSQGNDIFPEAHPNHLYRNEDGVFTEAELPSTGTEPFTLAAAWLQSSDGALPDLYLVNDFGGDTVPNVLYQPEGDGFTVAGDGTGAALGMFGMGIAQGDLNDDGYPDLWMSNYLEPVLLMSQGPRSWYETAAAVGMNPQREDQMYGWGAELADFENDGDLDAWMGWGPLPGFHIDPDDDAPEQPDSFFLNKEGSFTWMTESWDLADGNITRGGIMVDLDHDGLLDLLRSSMNGPAEIFWGSCMGGNWLEVSLFGGGMNSAGIGARIEVESPSGRVWTRWLVSGHSFSSGGPAVAHFGIGKTEEISELRVIWPDGHRTVERGPDPGSRVVVYR